MTGNAHRENMDSSILLQPENTLKKDSVTNLKQEFILIAKQYIPYQNCYDSFLDKLFAEFLSSLNSQNVATNKENSIVLLTEKISDYCKTKRAKISKDAKSDALKKLPQQSKMIGSLLSRRAAITREPSQATQEVLREKKKKLGQLIHWTPIVERICIAMNMGDVILSGNSTKKERDFLAINPIVWHKEFAAHEKVTEEEAFSRIMKSNSVITTPEYQVSSPKKRFEQRMKALFPLNQSNGFVEFQRQKISFQKKVRYLLKWTNSSPSTQSKLQLHLSNLSTHAAKIAVGIAYELPTNLYITSIMIKHIYDESRALQFLHKVDVRDWEERIFLLVPEEDPHIGRDAEVLFLALEELESREKEILSKVKHAN